MNGKELAEKRERCGLTQEQLAEFLGISRTSIWRIETGTEPISRGVETSTQVLEPGNEEIEAWIEALPTKQRVMTRRRQHKVRLKETA